MKKLKEHLNLLLAGVGGQGTVLASRVVGEAAVKSGYNTKTSETIGMAQREGSVISHLRLGERVHSPLISRGGADLLVSLEPAEAVRNLDFLSDSGVLLVNQEPVIPITVSAGISVYDDAEIREYLVACVQEKSSKQRIKIFNGSELAREAGSVKTLNSVMLGAVCALGQLPMADEVVLETLLSMVPPRTVEVNKNAFVLGRKAV